MTHKINTIKADLYNVFVKGNADNVQMARVFVILALPVLSLFLLVR